MEMQKQLVVKCNTSTIPVDTSTTCILSINWIQLVDQMYENEYFFKKTLISEVKYNMGDAIGQLYANFAREPYLDKDNMLNIIKEFENLPMN